jgi:hypothetical protein
MSTCNRTASWFLNEQTQGVRPNMRLKLSGAIVLRESECLCAGAHEFSFNSTAPASKSPAA